MRKSAWGYYNETLGLIDAGELANALEVSSEGIGLYPEDEPGLYVLRNTIYSALKEYDKAIADMSKVIALRSAASNHQKAKDFYFRGRLFYEKEDYSSASADFSESIRLNPKISTYYFNRGKARYYQGDPKNASKDFRQVLEIVDEKHPEALKAYQFLDEILKSI